MKKLAILLSTLVIGSSASAQTSNDILERDFREMMSWLEGEFDNSEQFYFEEEMSVPEEERKTRIHMTFKKVDVPEIGNNVYYLEQYTENNPQNIGRQRLFSFAPDYENHAIRMEALVFKDATPYVGAQSEHEGERSRQRDASHGDGAPSAGGSQTC